MPQNITAERFWIVPPNVDFHEYSPSVPDSYTQTVFTKFVHAFGAIQGDDSAPLLFVRNNLPLDARNAIIPGTGGTTYDTLFREGKVSGIDWLLTLTCCSLAGFTLRLRWSPELPLLLP